MSLESIEELEKENRISKKFSEFCTYSKNWIGSFKGGLTILCLIILSIVPFLTQNSYYLGLFRKAMLYAIFAASWDFLAGFSGQVSFGHAIFFGIAGYVTALFLKYFGFTWWLSLLLGSIAGVLFGLLIGIPCLRLKGPYLGLGTLIFGTIIWRIFTNVRFKKILRGSEGISLQDPFSGEIILAYFIWFIFMIVSFEALILITKSKMGTILKSIRDDSKGAEASGINLTKYKIIAFMISGFFAGIAGGLFAMQFYGVDPTKFQPSYSFEAIILASVGGLATISGSALGAFFWVFVSEAFTIEALSDWPALAPFIFAIILIIVIRFAEHGILKPMVERLKDLWDLLLGK